MSNLRLFIAGHVIGLSDPERAAERTKMNDESDFFDGIGFDVVNPVELLDDTSDTKDVLCKYIRMMLDCTHVCIFPDYLQFKECNAASILARTYGLYVLSINNILRGRFRIITNAIYDHIGVQYAQIASDSHEQPVQRAKAMFVKFCMDAEMPFDEIAYWLNIKCAPKSINQIVRRHRDKFDAYYKTDMGFRDDVKRIQADISRAERIVETESN